MRTSWLAVFLVVTAVRGQEPDHAASPVADAVTTRPGPGDLDASSETRTGAEPISSNPAAVDITTGTGALGRLLGIDEGTGIRFGGLWIGDASGILAGGRSPGDWGLNSLTISEVNLDADKLFGWSGASFGTDFLQFSGQPTNVLAGAFPGFDSLEVTPPWSARSSTSSGTARPSSTAS